MITKHFNAKQEKKPTLQCVKHADKIWQTRQDNRISQFTQRWHLKNTIIKGMGIVILLLRSDSS